LRISDKICVIDMIESIIIPNFCLEGLIKDVSKWPAIIFAINRIANVIGRIRSIIVSMIVINGIELKVVP